MPSTALHPYALARLAGSADPDSATSPGARFLLAVAEHVADRRDDGDNLSDLAHEVDDSAVPVYTADVWSTFVDLAGWQEDTSDLGDTGDDLTTSARLALFAIADRLAAALLDA